MRRGLIKESSLGGTDESLAIKDVELPLPLQPVTAEPPIITDHSLQRENVKGGKMVTFHSDLVTGNIFL